MKTTCVSDFTEKKHRPNFSFSVTQQFSDVIFSNISPALHILPQINLKML